MMSEHQQTYNLTLKQRNQLQSLQLIHNDTTPSITPAASVSLTSETCGSSRNKIMIRASNKSIFKRKNSAEAIKDNILKCRYNRRVGQLKELTQHNVQMFLRIKAQDSHYKFNTIQHEISCKMINSRTSRNQSQTPTSIATNSQNQEVKTDLRTRCFSLKRGLAKEFKSIANIASNDDDAVNFCKSTEMSQIKKHRIQRKAQRLNNKQNEVFNQQRNTKGQKYSNQTQLSGIQNKIIAKKLGLLIPNKDIAVIKEKNIFRRKQEMQTKRTVNISQEMIKNMQERQNNQKKKRQALAQKFYFEQNHFQQ